MSNRLVLGTILIAVALVAVWLIAPEVTLVILLLFGMAAELILYGALYLRARRHW
jgi:uncharacterized membrane protein YiaA